MVVKDLKSLKYTELQKLAKSAGIRANQKIDKLIKALEEHYIESNDPTEEKDASSHSKLSGRRVLDSKRQSGTPQLQQMAIRNHLKSKGTPTPTLLTKQPRKKTPPSSKPSVASAPSSAGITSKQVRKRRRTFELDEPTLSAANTPTFDSQSKKKTPVSTSADKKKTPASTIAGRKNTPLSRVIKKKTPVSTGAHKKKTLASNTASTKNTSLSRGDIKKNTPMSAGVGDRRPTRSSSKSNTPVEQEPAAKRQRRNTYDKTDSQAQDSCASPETTRMIESIDANQNSSERKANLLSAIDKKIQSKVAASPASSSQPSQIPRFMAYLSSMKKGTQPKPVTPGNKDWTKVHSKEFSRFDSLDVYLDKKQQRKDLLMGSGNRSNPRPAAKTNKTKIAKPVAKPQASVKAFVPTVMSTKNLSFNFTKTPTTQPAKSVGVTKPSTKPNMPQSASKTPKHVTPSVSSARKCVGSTNRGTPFKFTGGNTTSTMNTTTSATKKNVFDLKASLARPLTWKPHIGKLQPLDINMPSVAAAPKPTAVPAVRGKVGARPSRQALAAKARPTNPKDVRRVQQLDRRNNQKYIDMMKRRGLMA